MAGFGKLGQTLAELSVVPSQAAKSASTKIAKLIQEQFDRGEDSYGDGWANLAATTLARGRHPPPLTDTGALRNSITVYPTKGAGIEIAVGMDYGRFHQTGTQFMPARKILPDKGELPQEWEDAIEKSVSDAMQKRMK
jgi:hypothetical protein